MWEPRRLTSLSASTARYRDIFTLLLPTYLRGGTSENTKYLGIAILRYSNPISANYKARMLSIWLQSLMCKLGAGTKTLQLFDISETTNKVVRYMICLYPLDALNMTRGATGNSGCFCLPINNSIISKQSLKVTEIRFYHSAHVELVIHMPGEIKRCNRGYIWTGQ
jgi:hypothetical protein